MKGFDAVAPFLSFSSCSLLCMEATTRECLEAGVPASYIYTQSILQTLTHRPSAFPSGYSEPMRLPWQDNLMPQLYSKVLCKCNIKNHAPVVG